MSRRSRQFGLIVFMMMFILPMFMFAQDPEIDFGELIVKAQIVFVSGLGGLSVTALTELLKRLLKASGLLSVIISVVVSIVASVFYLVSTAQFTFLNLIVYSALVALVANGIFKFPKKTT